MACPVSLVRHHVAPEGSTISFREIVVRLGFGPTMTSVRGVPKARLDPRLHGYEDTRA
jgi:hypothetical protein